MSVDPLAAAAAANADLATLIDAELAQLAADAQALRALVVQDAVLTARVLPSNGLTDLLEIAGRRVAASLPPTVQPGDVLRVRVTGFDGERILLQVIATGADAAVEPPPVPLLGAPPAPVPPLPGTPSPPGVPLAPAEGTAPPAGGTSPRAIVPQTLPAPDVPIAPPAARPGAGAAFTSVASRANVVPPAADPATPAAGAGTARPPGAPPVRPIAVSGEPNLIEARLAAARAALTPPALGGEPAVPTGATRFVAPPQIAPKTPAAGIPAAAAPAAAPPRVTGLAAFAEPVALLRALRLPVTPSNVASAALALQEPDRLPAALAALERALPAAGQDANVATLRTLLGFVGRIDPRSPALAAQVAAYVDHVADGAEPKLATLLAASRAAAAPPPSAAPAAPAAAPHHAPPVPAAVAAERAAALNADLKHTLLAVAADPATPASLGPSLSGALTALTAVQVNAAQALAANPDGLAFTIPLSTPSGTANAHISVKRDAPQGRGVPLDAANFRIAFVLETAHYGTVAIDLVTVGRDVTVDVRTEAAPAMRAFRDALGALTGRLESLRYRVAAAGASVGTTSVIAVEAPPAAPADPDAVVDRSV